MADSVRDKNPKLQVDISSKSTQRSVVEPPSLEVFKTCLRNNVESFLRNEIESGDNEKVFGRMGEKEREIFYKRNLSSTAD